jgi:hypothetical protein
MQNKFRGDVMFKRLFSRRKAEQSVSKSHRYPIKMWEAIEQLAKDAGESPNGYVVLVLDQYLQVQLEKGLLKIEAFNNPEKIA